jgi:uncharacterized protein (TIGR02678 family)
MSDSPLREAQRTFTALLAHPLVTQQGNPELYRATRRHLKHLTESANRLGYRLQGVGRATKLVRLPVHGVVTAPPPPLNNPTRRVRALACVAAAACEEVEGRITLQKLSNLVAEITTNTSKRIGVYDPNLLAHRRLLVRAVAILEEWSVLRRRSVSDRIEEWTESRQGIGAGFEIDRDALLLFVSPEVAHQLTVQEHGDGDARNATRTMRALRALVETPAVFYADMDAGDAEELRGTRGLRATEANHTVGGRTEARLEGLVLLVIDDGAPSPVTVDWPVAATASWLSLVMLDMAGREGVRDEMTGVVVLASYQVDEIIEDFMNWKGEYLTRDLKNDPAGVRREAEHQLCHLGLLRVTPTGTWRVQPAAGRYRDPDVIHPTDHPIDHSTESPPVNQAENPAESRTASQAGWPGTSLGGTGLDGGAGGRDEPEEHL